MAIGSWRKAADAADEAAVAGRPVRNGIAGTSGNDVLVGTSGNDDFGLSEGGEDEARGLGGNDRFYLGSAYSPGDRIDGGRGSDVVFLDGTSDVTLIADQFKSVERFRFYGETNGDEIYTIGDGFEGLIIRSTRPFYGVIDASALTTGPVRFVEDHSHEVLIGGAKGDTFVSSLFSGEIFTEGGAEIDLYSTSPATALVIWQIA